jgi:Leucine-rich repeat (LRR) protein
VLPDSLEYLYCKYNRLASLPTLPDSLEWLSCCDNQLTALPELPNSLNDLDYFINPIYDIIEVLVDDADDISIVRSTINKLNRFKHLYYRLKFKLKFIQWFLRANERKIMEQTHPDKITALLASGVDVLDLDQHL